MTDHPQREIELEFEQTLARLRGRPPAGSWVPVPESGGWPGSKGYSFEDALKEAKRTGCPTVDRVVDIPGGWTTDDPHGVDEWLDPECQGVDP